MYEFIANGQTRGNSGNKKLPIYRLALQGAKSIITNIGTFMPHLFILFFLLLFFPD